MSDMIQFETDIDRKIRLLDEQINEASDEYMVNVSRGQLRLANSSKVTQAEKDEFFNQFCQDITRIGELQDEKTRLQIERGNVEKDDAIFHIYENAPG